MSYTKKKIKNIYKFTKEIILGIIIFCCKEKSTIANREKNIDKKSTIQIPKKKKIKKKGKKKDIKSHIDLKKNPEPELPLEKIIEIDKSIINRETATKEFQDKKKELLEIIAEIKKPNFNFETNELSEDFNNSDNGDSNFEKKVFEREYSLFAEFFYTPLVEELKSLKFNDSERVKKLFSDENSPYYRFKKFYTEIDKKNYQANVTYRIMILSYFFFAYIECDSYEKYFNNETRLNIIIEIFSKINPKIKEIADFSKLYFKNRRDDLENINLLTLILQNPEILSLGRNGMLFNNIVDEYKNFGWDKFCKTHSFSRMYEANCNSCIIGITQFFKKNHESIHKILFDK